SPASLKGVLSAREAAAFLAEGFHRGGKEVHELPIADGGEGTAEVLDTRVFARVRVSDAFGRPREAPIRALPDGTAVVEAPEAIGLLERRLAAMDELAPYAELPGAGAAGGLGAALAALGAVLVPGAREVLERLCFRDRVREASLVVTGEGTVDATTATGKAPGEALRICLEEGVRCLLFGGRVAVDLAGAETGAPSADPAQAADDLVALGERLSRQA